MYLEIKKMKVQKIHWKQLVSIIIMSFMVNASWSQKQSDYLLFKSGEKVKIYSLYQNGLYYSYKDNKGKKKTASARKIKEIRFGENFYMSLPMRQGGRELLQLVVAFNDKNILTSYKENLGYLHMYVLDRKYNVLEGHFDMHPGQIEEATQNLEGKIVKYFGDCDELINLLRANINSGVNAEDGILYYNCGEAEDITPRP